MPPLEDGDGWDDCDGPEEEPSGVGLLKALPDGAAVDALDGAAVESDGVGVLLESVHNRHHETEN